MRGPSRGIWWRYERNHFSNVGWAKAQRAVPTGRLKSTLGVTRGHRQGPMPTLRLSMRGKRVENPARKHDNLPVQ